MKTLSLPTEQAADEFEISPFVKSIATGTSIPNELDYKKEYAEHKLKKHK